MPEKKLILIDALALIYQSYHNPKYNSRIADSGIDVSTVYGFFTTIENIINTQKPSHMAIAFDVKKPTFRHKLYDKYKAGRKQMPEKIKLSIPIIKTILGLMNIRVIEMEGFEADDIIGTLAHETSAQGYNVLIISPDKDFYQLITQNISVCKLNKAVNDTKCIGIRELRNYFAVSDAKQIADIMALCGDESDNIPGIHGIGSRNARKLISQFGTIDNIYNNLDKLSHKHRELLTNNKEKLELYRKLVIIDIKVPINVNIENLRLCTFQNEKLRDYLIELNLGDLLEKHRK